MYSDNDLLMLSGIQHIAFCERQYALAYIENIWKDNVLTVQGHHLHERADNPFESDYRDGIITLRGVNIISYKLGLYGKADVLELEKDGISENSLSLEGKSGTWSIRPVEYKRGKPKPDVCDEVQLCAQAMCLEEMFNVCIKTAAIFYGEPRRRLAVELDSNLRNLTMQYAERMHQLFSEEITPKPIYKKHCHSCSLFEICKPKQFSIPNSVSTYLKRMLNFEE